MLVRLYMVIRLSIHDLAKDLHYEVIKLMVQNINSAFKDGTLRALWRMRHVSLMTRPFSCAIMEHRTYHESPWIKLYEIWLYYVGSNLQGLRWWLAK